MKQAKKNSAPRSWPLALALTTASMVAFPGAWSTNQALGADSPKGPCSDCLKAAAAAFGHGKNNQALEIMLAQSKLCQDHIGFQTMLMTVASRAGKDDMALAAAERVLKSNPDAAPALLHRGLIYYKQQDTDKARQSFERLVKNDPTSYEGWLSLKEIYQAANQPEKARIAGIKASYTEPGFMRAKLRILDTLNAQGNPQAFKTELKKQIDQYEGEQEPEIMIMLGDKALTCGFFKEALGIYNEAARAYPDLAPLKTRRVIAHLSLQDASAAAPFLDSLAKSRGDLSQRDLNILQAWHHIVKDDIASAQKLLAISNDKTNDDYLPALAPFVKGLLAQANKQYDIARQYLDEAIRSDKLNRLVVARLHLVQVERAMGNQEEAESQSKALETFACGLQAEATKQND